MVAFYIFDSQGCWNKCEFFGSGIFLIITIVSIVFDVQKHSNTINRTNAIVVSPSVIFSTSPRIPKDKSEEAFLLTAGNKVRIVDSISVVADSVRVKWYEVNFNNSHRGWTRDANIEKI